MDAEVVCLDDKGLANFDTLHSRAADHLAVACAFDLLMVNGDVLRRQPLRERKLALGKLLLRSLDGIQYVEHAEGHGDRMFEAVCKLGLEGIVSKRLTSVYRSGPSRAWLKIKKSEITASHPRYGRNILNSATTAMNAEPLAADIYLVTAVVLSCRRAWLPPPSQKILPIDQSGSCIPHDKSPTATA
jgi:hypothetical protein